MLVDPLYSFCTRILLIAEGTAVCLRVSASVAILAHELLWVEPAALPCEVFCA